MQDKTSSTFFHACQRFQVISPRAILFFRFVTNRRNKLPRNLYPEKRGQNKRNVVVSNAHRVRHYANAGDCVNLPNDIDLHFSSPLFPLSSLEPIYPSWSSSICVNLLERRSTRINLVLWTLYVLKQVQERRRKREFGKML